MRECTRLVMRAERVIRSCVTVEQLEVAARYVHRVTNHPCDWDRSRQGVPEELSEYMRLAGVVRERGRELERQALSREGQRQDH